MGINLLAPGNDAAAIRSAFGALLGLAATKTAAESMTFPVGVKTLLTGGYSSEGDAGGAVYTRVAAQPSHAAKVRSADRYLADGTTDATNGGWWVISSHVLTLQMFGCDPTGTADDTQNLRNAFHAACILHLPIATSGTYKYTDVIEVGSTTTSYPASGTADGFTLIGNPIVRFKPAATLQQNNLIRVKDASGVRFEHIGHDHTGASHGGGQIRLELVTGFVCNDISKINTGAAFATSGGSTLSIRHSLKGHISHIRCEGMGEFSAAVFTDAITDCYLEDLLCVGGQEVFDTTGGHRNTFVGIRGFDLTGEAMDLGASSHNKIYGVYVNGCARGISIKTEAPDLYTSEGSNYNTFEDIEVINYTDYGFYFGGGATSTQTLHGNKIKNLRLSTTVATSATIAIQTHRGDISGDSASTVGTEFDGVDIDQNAGYTLSLAPLTKYRFANIRSNAPIFTDDQVPSVFQQETGGVWENIDGVGDFSISAMRGYTIRNLRITGGGITLNDPVGVRASDVRVDEAPATALDVRFTNQTVALADKNFSLRGFRNTNNSKTTANSWGLRVRHAATSGPIENVRITDSEVVDNQGSPTSGGFSFANATFNHCTMTGCRTKTIANVGSTTFAGASSINSANLL